MIGTETIDETNTFAGGAFGEMAFAGRLTDTYVPDTVNWRVIDDSQTETWQVLETA